MNKVTLLWGYFLIYILLPALFLHYAMMKYPNLISSTTALITMFYLFSLFVFSILQLYIKWKSVPTGLSVISTIVYLNFIFPQIKMNYMGANIVINLHNFLLIIYLLLILKIILSIYYDIKEKHLSSMRKYTINE